MLCHFLTWLVTLIASALSAKGIRNRVDNWGPAWAHDWLTWRRMLPQYLAELT